MATFRIEKNKNYTVMSNYHLRDKDLSLKAKGLLSFMLSLPEEWDYSIPGLVACLKENKKAVTTTLDELKEYGYLKVNKVRNEKGLFEYEYLIFEQPNFEECTQTIDESPENIEIEGNNPEYQNGILDTAHPDTQNPYLDDPYLDDPHLDNGGLKINTNIININNRWIDRYIINNKLNNACTRNKYNNIFKEYGVYIDENVKYIYTKEAINEAIIKQLAIINLIETGFDMTLLNSIKLNNCYSKMMQHEIKDNPVNYLVEIIKNKVEREVIQYAG